MQKINIQEAHEFANKKESTIAQMERARIEAQAKKDSLRGPYKEYAEEGKALIEKLKPFLNIPQDEDLSENEVLKRLDLEIASIMNDLNTSIPDNI